MKNNEDFEKAARLILQLRDPRSFKIVFGEEPSFATVYAYALGIAVFSDARIKNAIKLKKQEGILGALETNYTGTDAENIKEFYEYFETCMLNLF